MPPEVFPMTFGLDNNNKQSQTNLNQHEPTVHEPTHTNQQNTNQQNTNQQNTNKQNTNNTHEPTEHQKYTTNTNEQPSRTDTTRHNQTTIISHHLYPTPNVNKTLLTFHQAADNKVFRVKKFVNKT